jgi:hypothetical protein
LTRADQCNLVSRHLRKSLIVEDAGGCRGH